MQLLADLSLKLAQPHNKPQLPMAPTSILMAPTSQPQ
jgi:hypothetical protein